MARRHSDQMPNIALINGKKHRLSVFLVVEREDGLPRECRLLREEETVTVREGMEFMTAYVPAVMFQPQEKR